MTVFHFTFPQLNFQVYFHGAPRLISRVIEIIERPGIARRPRRLDHAERLQSLDRHKPGTHCRCKALTQKWSERLGFPPLNVSRGPIIKKSKSENTFACLFDRDCIAFRVALPDPYCEFELIVELVRRSHYRSASTFWKTLTMGPSHTGRSHADGGRSTVVSDGNVFIVRG